jgi:hypothetical protein
MRRAFPASDYYDPSVPRRPPQPQVPIRRRQRTAAVVPTFTLLLFAPGGRLPLCARRVLLAPASRPASFDTPVASRFSAGRPAPFGPTREIGATSRLTPSPSFGGVLVGSGTLYSGDSLRSHGQAQAGGLGVLMGCGPLPLFRPGFERGDPRSPRPPGWPPGCWGASRDVLARVRTGREVSLFRLLDSVAIPTVPSLRIEDACRTPVPSVATPTCRSLPALAGTALLTESGSSTWVGSGRTRSARAAGPTSATTTRSAEACQGGSPGIRRSDVDGLPRG